MNQFSESVAVIGLGYVGLPLAVAMAEHYTVVGFDVNTTRVAALAQGQDVTGEVAASALAQASLTFTDQPEALRAARYYIIAVPTPIDHAKQPDLGPLIAATKMVAPNLVRGDMVIYESTVYPGVTDTVCGPLLAAESGMTVGEDFFIGYSPERMNPGDKAHGLANLVKVVSSTSPEQCQRVADLYAPVVPAGIYQAPSIAVAEAAKVIENTQRDINIAFVNELMMIFDRMGINVHEVLACAGTKWNFLRFSPGLVGGHCIGVDPYYLTYAAQQHGYHANMVLSGRKTNDEMGGWIARQCVKKMIAAGLHIATAKVGILGFTFKENCPDVRNSKVFDVVNELRDFHIEPYLYDPIADTAQAQRLYHQQSVSLSALADCEVILALVAHDCFRVPEVAALVARAAVVIDLKNQFADPVRISETQAAVAEG